MTDEIAENAEVAPDLLWGTFVRAEGGVLDWLDPDAPPHARALVRLWKQCGLMMSLGKRAWDELRPVLERAPVLQLINPPLDKAAAEGVIERHLHRCGARPRPVRWFPDARSARDYDAAAHYCARGVFPADASTPHAFTAAWLAGDLRPRHHHEWRLRGAGERREDRSVREIESPAHLLELFAAGVFYYWIGCDEVLCTARPSLWIVDGALHRADGPAVEWPTGERSFFWRGIEVPAWIIEHP